MKRFMGLGVVALALAVVSSSDAWGQCRGGGGGGQSAASGTTTAATGSTGSTGTLLTGPGSWAYDVMMAQQMQAAAMRQQMAMAAAKAKYRQERKAQSQAVARQRRASELYRREQSRQTLLAANR
jgi:hypothetical protein